MAKKGILVELEYCIDCRHCMRSIVPGKYKSYCIHPKKGSMFEIKYIKRGIDDDCPLPDWEAPAEQLR